MIPGDGSVGGAWALLGAVGWGRAADCWACLPRQPPALPRVWESSVPGRQVCVGQGAAGTGRKSSRFLALEEVGRGLAEQPQALGLRPAAS